MNTRFAPHAARGFTLMEILMAILLLSFLAVGLMGLNGQLFMQSAYTRNLQIGTQLQQACMEQVLVQRRNNGYTTTFNCNSLNTQGFTLTASEVLPVDYCPSGLQCRQIGVAVSGNGISPSAATLLFVDY